MKKQIKSLLGMVLSVCMVTTMVPSMSFADGNHNEYTYYDPTSGTKMFSLRFNSWEDEDETSPYSLEQAVNMVEDLESVTLYAGDVTLNVNKNYNVTVEGGTLTLTDMGDDDGNAVVVNGGKLYIKTGTGSSDDDIDSLTINGGECYIEHDKNGNACGDNIDCDPILNGGTLVINDAGRLGDHSVHGTGNGKLENYAKEGLGAYGTFGAIEASADHYIKAVGAITVDDGTATIDQWDLYPLTVNGGTITTKGSGADVTLNGGSLTLGGWSIDNEIDGASDNTKGGDLTISGTYGTQGSSAATVAYVTGGTFKSITVTSSSSNNPIVTTGDLTIKSGTNTVYNHNSTGAVALNVGAKDKSDATVTAAWDNDTVYGFKDVTVYEGSGFILEDNNSAEDTLLGGYSVVGEGGAFVNNDRNAIPAVKGKFAEIYDGGKGLVLSGKTTIEELLGDMETRVSSKDNGNYDLVIGKGETVGDLLSVFIVEGTLDDEGNVINGIHDVTLKEGAILQVNPTDDLGLMDAAENTDGKVYVSGTITGEGGGLYNYDNDPVNITGDFEYVEGAYNAVGDVTFHSYAGDSKDKGNGKDITINDGGTHTLTGDFNKVTVTNGTVTVKGTVAEMEIAEGNDIYLEEGADVAKITLTDAYLVMNKGSEADEVNLTDGSKLVMNEGSEADEINLSEGSVLEMNSDAAAGFITAEGGSEVTMNDESSAEYLEVTGTGTAAVMNDSAEIDREDIEASYKSIAAVVVEDGATFEMGEDNSITLSAADTSYSMDLYGIWNEDGTVTVNEGSVYVLNKASGTDGHTYGAYNKSGSMYINGAEITVNASTGANECCGVYNAAANSALQTMAGAGLNPTPTVFVSDALIMNEAYVQANGGSGITYGVKNTGTAYINGGYSVVICETAYSGDNSAAYGVHNSGKDAVTMLQNFKIEVTRPEGKVYGLYNNDGAYALVTGGHILADVNNGTSYGVYTASTNNYSEVQILAGNEDVTVDDSFETEVTVEATAENAANATAFYAGTNSFWAIRGNGSTFTAGTAADKSGYALRDQYSYGMDSNYDAALSGGTFVGKMQSNKDNGISDLILANHYVKTGDSLEVSEGTAAAKDTDGLVYGNYYDNGEKVVSAAKVIEAGTYTVTDAEWELRTKMADGGDYTLPVNVTLCVNDKIWGNTAAATVGVKGTSVLDLNGLTVKPIEKADAKALLEDVEAIANAMVINEGADLTIKSSKADGTVTSDWNSDTIYNEGTLKMISVEVPAAEEGADPEVILATVSNTSTESVNAITSTGTVEINGNVSSAEGSAIVLESGATGSVSGGTIESTGTKVNTIVNKGTITEISGGTIYGNYVGIYNDGGTITEISGGTIKISGGTITNIALDNKGKIDKISGGTFYGTNMGVEIEGGTITEISGGTIGKITDENGKEIHSVNGIMIYSDSKIGTISGGDVYGSDYALNYSYGYIGEITGGTFVSEKNNTSCGGMYVGSSAKNWNFLKVKKSTADGVTTTKGAAFSGIAISSSAKKVLADLFDRNTTTYDDVLTLVDANGVELGGYTIRDENYVKGGDLASEDECKTGTVDSAKGTVLAANFTVIPRTVYEVYVGLSDAGVEASGTANNSNNRYDDSIRTLFVKAGSTPSVTLTATEGYLLKDVMYEDLAENGSAVAGTAVANYNKVWRANFEVDDYYGSYANQAAKEFTTSEAVNQDKALGVVATAKNTFTYKEVERYTNGAAAYTFVNEADDDAQYKTDAPAVKNALDPEGTVDVAEGNSIVFDFVPETGRAIHSFTINDNDGRAKLDLLLLTSQANGDVGALNQTGEYTVTASEDQKLTLGYCDPVSAPIVSSADVFLGNTVDIRNADAHITDNPTWSSSYSNIASVDQGIVKGDGLGTSTVSLDNGAAGTYNCTVYVFNNSTTGGTTTGSSGGGGGGGGAATPSYSVSTDTATANGTVKFSSDTATSGKTVTITVTPDEGYEVANVTVKDASGKAVTVTKNADGTYSFTMPASAVTVLPTFTKAAETTAPETTTTPETSTETPADTTTTAGAEFNDVADGAWYESAVDYVTSQNIMTGYDEDTFAPNDKLSRAMLAQILYNYSGKPETTAADYKDVAASAWYSNAVAWASAQGVVTGYGNGKFGPNDSVTREQLATMLYRFAGSPAVTGNLSAFKDASKASAYAKDALAWAVEQGIISGNGSADKLDPKGQATRAQVAVMMMRYLSK